MAKLEKRNKGWLARVRRKGIDEAHTFDTKKEAVEWLTTMDRQIDTYGKNSNEVATNQLRRKTLRETLTRYVEEVSPIKKGHGSNQVNTFASVTDLNKIIQALEMRRFQNFLFCS